MTPMKQLAPHIVVDLAVRFGKPVIEGTRITVEEVMGALAGGMEFTEIEKEYGLAKKDILAAINYTSSFVTGEMVHTAQAASV